MPRRVWFKKRPNNGRRASDDDDGIKKYISKTKTLCYKMGGLIAL